MHKWTANSEISSVWNSDFSIVVYCLKWYQQSEHSALMLLVGTEEGHPACKKTEWWGAGMVICLERVADLHMAQLMPLPLTVSCFSKIQIGFTFLVPAHLGSPWKKAHSKRHFDQCSHLSTAHCDDQHRDTHIVLHQLNVCVRACVCVIRAQYADRLTTLSKFLAWRRVGTFMLVLEYIMQALLWKCWSECRCYWQ